MTAGLMPFPVSARRPRWQRVLRRREKLNQARGIPPAAAARLHTLIELVDESGDREGRPVASGFFEADGEILAHQVDGEAEIELAVDHCACSVFELPRLRRAPRKRRGHLVGVEPCTQREVQSLGEALKDARENDLI